MRGGLLKEVAFPIDMGRWVVERHWDLKSPGCPVVLSPFHSQLGNKDVWIEQRILAAMEYRELFGTNGHPSQASERRGSYIPSN